MPAKRKREEKVKSVVEIDHPESERARFVQTVSSVLQDAGASGFIPELVWIVRDCLYFSSQTTIQTVLSYKAEVDMLRAKNKGAMNDAVTQSRELKTTRDTLLKTPLVSIGQVVFDELKQKLDESERTEQELTQNDAEHAAVLDRINGVVEMLACITHRTSPIEDIPCLGVSTLPNSTVLFEYSADRRSNNDYWRWARIYIGRVSVHVLQERRFIDTPVEPDRWSIEVSGSRALGELSRLHLVEKKATFDAILKKVPTDPLSPEEKFVVLFFSTWNQISAMVDDEHWPTVLHNKKAAFLARFNTK